MQILTPQQHAEQSEMRFQEWRWQSPNLDREMAVACWGHYGKPVLLFPTSGGDHLDVARFLLIDAVAPLIQAGRIKVYGLGNISREAWMSRTATPWHKSWLQARFDAYLRTELFPFVKRDCGDTDERFVVAGASLGAYNAINAGAKHPDWIELSIAMSGWFDLDVYMGNHRDQNYYFNNPLYFVPGLREGAQLQALRQSHFILALGTGRWEHPEQSIRMNAVLQSKGIPTTLDFWGRRWDHDWPTWRAMLPHFLGERC